MVARGCAGRRQGAALSGKRFVSSAELRQFGNWCHERGIAAIKADQNIRKHKNSGVAQISEAR